MPYKWILLLLVVSQISCSNASRPDALITLEGAKEVESFTLNGMKVLQYQMQVKYPAQHQISHVRQTLQKTGWKPLDYTYLFPKVESSHVTGWTYFNDPPKNPSFLIYEWSGDWQDPKGNIVTYTFRYRDSIEKYKKSVFTLRPAHADMEVTAIFMPARVARKKQEQLNPRRA